jgi:hypothetical protein
MNAMTNVYQTTMSAIDASDGFAYARGMARKIPRPFKYPWGGGQIVEEASATREHSEPTLQLLEFQDDGHEGYVMIRFCSYTPSGSFRRHPMLASADDIAQLRAALKATPRLRALLAGLVSD